MKAIVNCAAWTNVDACETDAIITILDKVKAAQGKDEYVGVYHFSNEGVCS